MVLKNGMVVYIAEDRALPLVNIALTVRVGSWLEPAGKEGLAGFTGSQMRRGGTKSLTAEQLDEKLEFLAAQVSTGIGPTSGSAGLNCLSDNLDEALAIFVEMLREPRFQEDRLALAKEQALQEMKKRNDDSADIEGREWGVLLYGEDFFTNRFTTEASVKGLTRDDLASFHRQHFHPANMIAAVSGSFTRAEMIRKLEAAFAGWPSPKIAAAAHPGHDLSRRARPLPGREGREPGPGLDRPAHGEARPPGRLRPRGDERDPRRERLHRAHHEDRALERGARLLRGLGAQPRRVVPRPLPGRVPVEEPLGAVRHVARARGDPEDPRGHGDARRSSRPSRTASSRPSPRASPRRRSRWRSSPRTSTRSGTRRTGRPTATASGR